ncbi:alanine--tRNA ligase [Candidatus Viridilinea mediisalina]|uniref:Alanine--tRNA ligase n=1 Tax=Candidatus Viridilinea mediisalina TaxID=2024553 RepID=A0A2A6RI78_9CHLR|nr:alanine--tRNA ligase [Candidatus Viridilinea mediisalina]PDW02722.1 alanine--tRNA ligase [Candidatus Viridilinea mediisalina]
MQKLRVAEIRERFLAYFERNGHTRVASSSLVVANDPTLLFTNSGMVQFKDVFLGAEQRPYLRAATAQKCLRVSGKHNDLEEVGPSPRHHTFFEMLGNFSFGDYFKAEAIRFSWELLTQEFQLPVERLWFTVFEGDAEVPADDEAAQLWINQGADPSRVLRFGRKDNFWIMGDTGPCGPCSEITVYLGDDLSKMRPEGVNSDDPDYVEIWNNVFMQYDRATMQPLPRPSVDTGMGLERMAMVLQGVRSNYETDAFVTIIERVMAELGSDAAHYRAHFANYRAIADHARAVAFLIADGVLPGNAGRSYVLRRILRRAAYQGRGIGFEAPFLAKIIATVIDDMAPAYPELVARREFILESADAEERQFLRTLTGGIARLKSVVDQVQAEGGSLVAGQDAFVLKDTFGFPLDLTQKIAAEQGLQVDEAGYDQAMQAQRERSRAAAKFTRGDDAELWSDRGLPATRFIGYDTLVTEATVLALVAAGDVVAQAHTGAHVQVVLDQTPFYAESGGQVGDTGKLIFDAGMVEVSDTLRPVPGLIVHYGTLSAGSLSVGQTLRAEVDAARRTAIMRNHTATHLLHRALRDVVGEHAAQAGSLVAPERLRFDFTHNKALDAATLRTIEARLNTWVRADGQVSWAEMSYQAALDSGAIALFGEKYSDLVRVVTIERGAETASASFASRDSRELCGGTHVTSTGQIGYVRLLAESSIGSGIRRIEALTGHKAEAWAEQQAQALRELANRLGVAPNLVVERVEQLLGEAKQRQQELNTLRGRLARSSLEQLLEQVQHEHGVPLLAAQVEAEDVARLREMGDFLRDRLGSGVIVLGTVIQAKPLLLVMVTPDLVTQGYHAGKLVKALAAMVGGGGGGRPDMAQAGGKDPAQLGAALAQAGALVAAQGA